MMHECLLILMVIGHPLPKDWVSCQVAGGRSVNEKLQIMGAMPAWDPKTATKVPECEGRIVSESQAPCIVPKRR